VTRRCPCSFCHSSPRVAVRELRPHSQDIRLKTIDRGETWREREKAEKKGTIQLFDVCTDSNDCFSVTFCFNRSRILLLLVLLLLLLLFFL